MKKLLLLLFAAILASCDNTKRDPLRSVEEYILTQMDSMFLHIEAMKQAVEENLPSSRIKHHFAEARTNYKRIECLSEYYFPNMSEFLNGPALKESEEYDDKIIEATGFQVLEEFIFSVDTAGRKEELLHEIKTLLKGKKRFVQLVNDNRLNQQNVFEAVRLQLLRIASLGISGFDSPIAQRSIVEARAALQGIEQLLVLSDPDASDRRELKRLRSIFHKAFRFLDDNPDFVTFDRATFLKDYLIPMSENILSYQKLRNIPENRFVAAVNMNETNFFSQDFLNASFFSPDVQTKPKDAVIELGRTLFFDPILSGNNSRSCASCHQPSKAFADNRRKSLAFNFSGEMARNTPTLINSGFQRQQFWDQRVQFIEDQISDVISNHDEMHGDIKKSIHTLMKSAEYREMFQEAFPEKSVHDERDLRTAIATYVRSLKGLNSSFDRYMTGDSSQVTIVEIKGFNLFMGKAKCGTCHFLPLFNGTLPPSYNDTEAEILGVPAEADTIEAQPDPDWGKYYAYKRDLFRNAFKTPTVRNAALTGPYMHNGVYNTLEEVIDFYNRGGGAGIGIELVNQTLPTDRLGLTAEEKNHLIAFINSLTDTTGLTRSPASLPFFEDRSLNRRVIGGLY